MLIDVLELPLCRCTAHSPVEPVAVCRVSVCVWVHSFAFVCYANGKVGSFNAFAIELSPRRPSPMKCCGQFGALMHCIGMHSIKMQLDKLNSEPERDKKRQRERELEDHKLQLILSIGLKFQQTTKVNSKLFHLSFVFICNNKRINPSLAIADVLMTGTSRIGQIQCRENTQSLHE